MAMEGQSVSAFSLLPELVWELVLDSMDDSKDIHNVLLAFPELDVRFHRKKTLWLFDQVFPHLINKFKYVEKSKLVNVCRQSCKRWCSVTDNFIRTHPSRRPYNQDGLNRRTVPYREFSYNEFDWLQTGHRIRLNSVQKIRSFHDALAKFVNPVNPLKTFKVRFIGYDEKDPKEFLNAVLAFLESFGRHIWDVAFSFPMFLPQNVKSAKKTLLKIFKCLSYLPSVQSLSLSFDFHAHFRLTDLYKSNVWFLLPKLAHLESVQLSGNSSLAFHRRFIKHFKPQVRKLVISKCFLNCSLCLKNLVELDIYFGEERYTANSVQSTIKRFPLLKRLTLCDDVAFFGVGERRTTMTASNVFGLLDHAQLLEELDLHSFLIIRDTASLPKDLNGNKYSSLKYLKLADHKDQKLDFLTALPALEHLDIYWAVPALNEAPLDVYSLTWKETDALTSTVRFYIYEPVVPAAVSIWEKLSSLKLLTTWQSFTFVKKFARECGNKPFYAYVRTPLPVVQYDSDGSYEMDVVSDTGSEDVEMAELESDDGVELPNIHCGC